MADLPKDPMILLSVVNTKLRDFYADLDTLCQEMQILFARRCRLRKKN